MAASLKSAALALAFFMPFAALHAGAAHAQNCLAAVANNVGDTITVTAALATTDPNENGEGETLTLTSSGGEPIGTIGSYSVAVTFTYTAVKANECR